MSSTNSDSPRVLTVYYAYLGAAGNSRQPLIRLQGKWLHDLGFQIGVKIAIEEREGALIIRQLPELQPDGGPA